MKTSAIAMLVVFVVTAGSTRVWAGDFDGPTISGGNDTAHAPYVPPPPPKPPEMHAPTPEPDTHVIIVPGFPINYPVVAPRGVEQPELPEHVLPEGE